MAANQGSTTMRNLPDVALTADNVYVTFGGGQANVFGGTSCATPLWAAFTALVNQQAVMSGRPTVGFINPALDTICSGGTYTTCFHDITTGNNTSPSSPNKFYAVAGYDLCTGWGVPDGQSLINALATPDPLGIQPDSGFTAIGGSGGPFTVTSEGFVVSNSGTNSLNWSMVNTSLWLTVSPPGGTLAGGGSDPNALGQLERRGLQSAHWELHGGGGIQQRHQRHRANPPIRFADCAERTPDHPDAASQPVGSRRFECELQRHRGRDTASELQVASQYDEYPRSHERVIELDERQHD